MSSDVVVSVNQIGKRYRIGRASTPHGTLGEALSAGFSRLVQRVGSRSGDERPGRPADYWALQDISFKVERGDVLGILGHNGAGKSTLLKILSRITEPTAGEVTLKGRVGSLLEVGSGFHMELSGRENVYLNGAILGMDRREIRRKFDEIVDFAEIGAFIDTPVKRYSSGMHARLAFSVAAHLETSILIVDEVLAVGDFAFQERCLGKMRDAGQSGRTVLFVSHNLAAVRSLCSRGILLERGRMVLDASSEVAVAEYLERYGTKARGGRIPRAAHRLFSTGEAFVDRVEVLGSDGEEVKSLYVGQRFVVRVVFEVAEEIRDGFVEVDLATVDGLAVSCSTSVDGGGPPGRFTPGWYCADLELDVVLVPQRYTVTVGLHHFSGETIDWVERVAEVAVANVSQEGVESFRWTPRGMFRPSGEWRLAGTDDPCGSEGDSDLAS
jgi:lipopolysaccharide transport system ATP-binding protein